MPRMVTYSTLIVSDAELVQLAVGVVPPKVQRRAAVLNEDMDARLRRNAARAAKPSRRGFPGIPRAAAGKA